MWGGEGEVFLNRPSMEGVYAEHRTVRRNKCDSDVLLKLTYNIASKQGLSQFP